ncbi:UDP-3-O-(3-hydroxymyristoyl)glucosamine N-acyltransferase [Lewinellaceae bacterium SD302]|nr:UDP-3-O-(3-hydroxymyristoyl)glucosamine N-acyltransferase [Lewinellaceae bacterium SD302]
MKIKDPQLTAAALAAQAGGRLIGDGSLLITGANEIHHVEKGDLCFVDFHKYYRPTLESAASVILIDQEQVCPAGKALIVVDEPFFVYNELVKKYRGLRNSRALASGTFSATQQVGEGTIIEAGAHLSEHVTIGKNCHIYPGAFIGEHTVIGDGVIVHPGAAIGSEAFYFKSTPEGRIPWTSGGYVILEDQVEIGPNCSIAKGVSSATVIGKGTKLDALVQIGHDCKIGPNCLLTSQVGIAGNTTLGANCILYGQVGVIQNVTIGDGAVILGQSGVGNDLEGGKVYFGSPCVEKRVAYREMLTLRRLAR